MTPADLFEASSPLATRLRGASGDLLTAARTELAAMTEDERAAVLAAHPPIGATAGLSAHSRREQGGDSDPGLLEELQRLNEEYERRFGFRFVVHVAGRPRSALLAVLRERLANERQVELAAGLEAILAIAADRLRNAVGESRHSITYGKHGVTFFRAHATPLTGVRPIPESSFSGRGNLLFGGVVDIDVHGDEFLASYTEGDNSLVVATDTMKNFVYAMALEYTGATHEGFAVFLARRLLGTYEQISRVRVRIIERPFVEHSERLLSWSSGGDHGTVEVEVTREGIAGLLCGRSDLRLVKLTGSAFADFQRDAYTTLKEVRDRPLHIFMDVAWRYLEPEPLAAGSAAGLVPSEQVRDLCVAVFDRFVSMSIQHLVNEMGERVLERFPALAEVSFVATNRLWDTSITSDSDPSLKVFSDPKPAHGNITLTLRR